ncbi:MAG: T9SS C-terminal target domain-containing protein [Ignavibacteriales bacterium]|nr:MAG: T9SS C-terminal target domain-containing protein [Ignavibacteriales bacterium]
MALINIVVFTQSKSSKESFSSAWQFVVIGDTHVAQSDTIKEMIPFILADNPSLILVCGDLVDAGRNTTAEELESQLKEWISIFTPLYDRGIEIYPVRGNHEDDARDDILAWNKIFSASKMLPQNGPSGEENLTYSFIKNNAMFIGLDNYVNIHRVNQEWLNQQLALNNSTHLFVFGHEAAFKVFHTDCLDDYPEVRNKFWESLVNAGARAYFCGHDHFYDLCRIDNNDGDNNNDIYQVLTGGGGGWLMSNYNYNGVNSPFRPTGIYHKKEHGYVVVELNGISNSDCDVTITWKERTYDSASSGYIYSPTNAVLKYSAVPKIQTAIDNEKYSIASTSNLTQNYPNPFNPSTVISYQLASPSTSLSGISAFILVSLKVYDVLGREVATLVDEYKQSGRYSTIFTISSSLSTGIYFYQLKAGDFVETKKMMLIK